MKIAGNWYITICLQFHNNNLVRHIFNSSGIVDAIIILSNNNSIVLVIPFTMVSYSSHIPTTECTGKIPAWLSSTLFSFSLPMCASIAWLSDHACFSCMYIMCVYIYSMYINIIYIIIYIYMYMCVFAIIKPEDSYSALFTVKNGVFSCTKKNVLQDALSRHPNFHQFSNHCIIYHECTLQPLVVVLCFYTTSCYFYYNVNTAIISLFFFLFNFQQFSDLWTTGKHISLALVSGCMFSIQCRTFHVKF